MNEGYILGGGGGPDLDVITAGAEHVRAGKVIVDRDGNPLTGTEPERGTWNGSVGMNGKLAIPGGHHSGSGYVNGPSVPYQNADIAGTDRAGATNISGWSGTICLGVRKGHYLNGVNWIQGNIPNFTAANIKKNVNIAGLVGNFEGIVSSPYYIVQNGWVVNLTNKTFTKVGELRFLEVNQGTDGYQGYPPGFQFLASDRYGGFMFSESINLTNHNYLKADILYTNVSATFSFAIGFMTLANANAVTNDMYSESSNVLSKFTAHTLGNVVEGQTVILDVRNLSGNYFLVVVARYNRSNYAAGMMLSNIYLSTN